MLVEAAKNVGRDVVDGDAHVFLDVGVEPGVVFVEEVGELAGDFDAGWTSAYNDKM